MVDVMVEKRFNMSIEKMASKKTPTHMHGFRTAQYVRWTEIAAKDDVSSNRI